jgi:hypothetical protein
MDQLLEGIPRGTKKLQILRVEASRDPLSSSGEWKLIGPTSQDVGGFVKSLTVYSGGTPPTPRGDMARLASVIPQMANVLDTESTSTAPGGEDDSANSSGPFLGVASRSQRNSVMTYYGIDRHDAWIFTPLFRSRTFSFTTFFHYSIAFSTRVEHQSSSPRQPLLHLPAHGRLTRRNTLLLV